MILELFTIFILLFLSIYFNTHIIFHIFILFFCLKYIKKYRMLIKTNAEQKQIINHLKSIVKSKSKIISLTNNEKHIVHNQIIIFNNILNHLNNDNKQAIYKIINHHLHSLYELRLLTQTPYYEFNYMIAIYKTKLKNQNINFKVNINSFTIHEKMLYDFIFCISHFLDSVLQYDLNNKIENIDMCIQIKGIFIVCCFKCQNFYLENSSYTCINSIIKRYDGAIISLNNEYSSEYKLYFKT